MTFIKDPLATLDYTVDWSAWLATGDTLASVVWTVPTGLTKTTSSNTTTAATIWLSGGNVTVTYNVTCDITTVDGRIDARELVIQVQSK